MCFYLYFQREKDAPIHFSEKLVQFFLQFFDYHSKATNTHGISCILCRYAGGLAMLLPLYSLEWWRCQLIPSSFHSARILKSTKEQPNMLLPFSLRRSMTKTRCRDLPNDPPKTSQIFVSPFFIFTRIRESYDILYAVACSPFPSPLCALSSLFLLLFF